ncbi:HDIG domain-containing metalloprotein [Glaciecola sp. 1036]|uniref:HDIG domain-containing metalloprotein n=1 Tax=Alteromonadaceae TaxID=72275 RepID=UPI003D00CD9D
MTTANRLTRLQDMFNVNRFIGQFYLVGFVTKVDIHGKPYVQITLSDATANAQLYCIDQACIYGDIQPESYVDIEAQCISASKMPYFRCKFIQPCDLSTRRISNIYKLPVARCAYPHVLAQFIELVESITTPALSDFLSNVLLNNELGFKFIQCPASLNHHHNYRSGLLVHSVEVAKQVANDKTLNKEERELGIIAALLHDIGKTQTFTADMTRSDLGYLVDHSELTLELCAPALNVLSKAHLGYANQLRHAWTCASPNARYGFKAKTKVAQLLQHYDASSANR